MADVCRTPAAIIEDLAQSLGELTLEGGQGGHWMSAALEAQLELEASGAPDAKEYSDVGADAIISAIPNFSHVIGLATSTIQDSAFTNEATALFVSVLARLSDLAVIFVDRAEHTNIYGNICSIIDDFRRVGDEYTNADIKVGAY